MSIAVSYWDREPHCKWLKMRSNLIFFQSLLSLKYVYICSAPKSSPRGQVLETALGLLSVIIQKCDICKTFQNDILLRGIPNLVKNDHWKTGIPTE